MKPLKVSKVPFVSTDATQYSKAFETRMAVECTDTVFCRISKTATECKFTSVYSSAFREMQAKYWE